MFIYKLSMTLWKDMFRFRAEKFECKETLKCYILLDKQRINKDKIDVISNDAYINDTKSIRYTCWILDKDKIKDIRIELIDRIKTDLNNYMIQINKMINMSNTEPINDFRDYTKEIEKFDDFDTSKCEF